MDKKIYMKDPSPDVKDGAIVQVRKSLYGAKQAAFLWNDDLNREMTKLGFRRSPADPCCYLRGHGEEIMIVLIYVDDLVVMAKQQTAVNAFKSDIMKKYKMEDKGPIYQFLGMKIDYDAKKRTVKLSQKRYTESLLKRFGMKDSKPVGTPADSSLQLIELAPARGHQNREDSEIIDEEDFVAGSSANSSSSAAEVKDPATVPTDITRYRQIVGSLMHLAVATRPDIAFAVNVVARYMANPSKAHLVAAKRIFRYLRGTVDQGLTLGGEDLVLIGYADADWAGELDGRRSTSGYVFYYGGPVTWMVQRQKTIALSSTESEYYSLAEAGKEAIWLRSFLSALGVQTSSPTVIMDDNQGAIALAQNPVHHARTKHIDVKIHFIRDCIKNKVIEVQYVPIADQVADIMTKALARPLFRKLSSELGIQSG